MRVRPMLQRSSNCMFPELYLASQCGETRNLLEPGTQRSSRPSSAANETALRLQKQQKDRRQEERNDLLNGSGRLARIAAVSTGSDRGRDGNVVVTAAPLGVIEAGDAVHVDSTSPAGSRTSLRLPS